MDLVDLVNHFHLFVKYDPLKPFHVDNAGQSPTPPKKKLTLARGKARALIWKHRVRLGIGLAVMVVNRLAGLVMRR